MTNYPTRTYRELLTATGITAGVGRGASGQTKDRLDVFINSALRMGWEGYRWPYLTVIEEATAGDASDYNGENVIDITRQDPAQFINPQPVTWGINHSGITILDERIEDDTYLFYVYMRRFYPLFGEDYSAETTYAENELAYSQTDGDWFRSVVSANLGNPLARDNFWEREGIPSFLFDFTRCSAAAEWHDSQGDIEEATALRAQANTHLVSEIDKLEYQKGLIHRTEYPTR